MPQGTSASWYALRQQSGKAADRIAQLEADTATSHQELVSKIQEYGAVDFIIVDAPPRIAEITRAILVLADVCIVPVAASAAEIWATSDIITLIEEAKGVKTIVARMLWTRYRGNTKLAQTLSELANKELGLMSMSTTLGMRVAYMEALGQGLTVTEMSDQSAKAEGKALAEETIKLLRKKK
jgi:chromosome partitioning protein